MLRQKEYYCLVQARMLRDYKKKKSSWKLRPYKKS